MLLYEEIPDWIVKKRDSWEAEYRKWDDRTKILEGYYYNDVDETGTTFTQEQKSKVENNTGIPVSLNKIYSVIEQKLAILTQTKPSSKVIAYDTKAQSKQFAYVLDKCKNSIMYHSQAILEQKEAMKDMLVLGMGITGIFPKQYDTMGDFGLEYLYLHPSEVRLDVNSKRINNSDMSGFFITKELDEETAKEMFTDKIAAINFKFGTEYKLTDFARSDVLMSRGTRGGLVEDFGQYKYDTLEYYTKEVADLCLVKNPEGNIEFLFAENLEEELKVLLTNTQEIETNRFVVKYTMLGNKLIEKEFLPITEFPIRVRYFNWGGKPYRSYGVAHYLRGMQDAQDKAVQLLIQNGMLTNNAGWEAPYGSIDAAERVKWEQMGNKPGIIKEYKPVILENTVMKPERTQIQQLSNFYPMLIDMMDKAMEVSSGVHPFMSGDPKQKIDVFSTLQQYQNAGSQRILMALMDIQVAEEYIGNVLVQWLVVTLKPDENYVLFDAEAGDFNEVQIANDIMTDFKLARYKVMAIPSESTQSQRIAMSTELMKISQTTPDPAERAIYIKKAFQLADMRGFDEVQKEVDTAKNLQSQIQQLQEELKRAEEIQKQLENKVIASEIKAKVAEGFYGAIDNVTTAEAETKKDLEISKLKEELKMKGKDNAK